MVAIEAPLLLISAPKKSGRRRLWIEVSSVDSTTLQLQHVLRGYARGLEVIDGAGQYYPQVDGTISGIDWRLYLQGGMFSPLALLLDLLFCSVMVRVRLDFKEPGRAMPLVEIKSKVREAILGNPRIYTHAPVETIVGRVNAARNSRSLIQSIGRD